MSSYLPHGRAGLALATALSVISATAAHAAAQDPAAAQAPPPAATKVAESILVTGKRRTAYSPPPTRSATKTDTPLLETPQSVQVVTRSILDDQQATTLQDATRNVAGASGAFGFFGQSNACVRIRGFTTEQGSVGCTYYRDGVRVWAQPIAFDTVESVDVVKGPNTVLFGRNEPGGFVNVVTKAPSGERVFAITQTLGSFNTAITQLDLGGALNDSKTLTGRINAGYSSTDSYRDRAFDRLGNLNIALGWAPDESNQVDLRVDLTRDTYQPDFGVPALGTRPAPVPVTLSYKQDYIDSRTDAIAVQLSGQHRFNADWQAHGSLYFSYQLPEYFNVYGYGLDETTKQYPVTYFAEQYSWRRTFAGSVDVTGKAEILGMQHSLLIGADGDWERYDGPIFYAAGSDVGAPPLDLFNPAIGSAPKIYPDRSAYTPYGSIQKWFGLYAQDQIHLTDQWILNLGGRFDNATFAFSPDPLADAVSETALKPRVGLVFLPRPNISLYVQYQEGFGPSNGRSSSGQVFSGQTADQIEVGAKYQSPGKTLLATLALYDLRKQNLVTGNPATPDPNDSIAVGEVRNQGIELDVSGQLTQRFSLIASYAYANAVTTRDFSGYQGLAYEGVPRHAGSLWGRYQATEALAFGGGVFMEAKRPGDLANSYTLPGYARLDLFTQYRFVAGPARWTLQLNLQNILDQRYFAGIYRNARDFILPGSPRAVMGTIKAEF